MVLRAEVDFVEAAGSRSPATVYPPRPATAPGRSSTNRPAPSVETITASMQSVHVLTVGPDADKHTALAAISAAATGKASTCWRCRPPKPPPRSPNTTPTPNDPPTRPPPATESTTGSGPSPPGNLLIIDDADHLDPNQLRYFTEHAGRTNTKLLLVHTPTERRTPAHSLVDALADNLPWAQHVGTPHHRPRHRDRPRRHAPRRHTNQSPPKTATPPNYSPAATPCATPTKPNSNPAYATHTHEHTRDHGLEL